MLYMESIAGSQYIVINVLEILYMNLHLMRDEIMGKI